jgi:hypothetical protein
MRQLTGNQTRQLIDAEQLYDAFRLAQREYRQRYLGSMAWKTVSGRRYLYRKTDGVWKSLGPHSADTELAHQKFHAGRVALKARSTNLDAEIRAMAPVNRAMQLGRVPWTTARIIRRLERLGLLGHGLRIAGTHALYVYERMGGVHFMAESVATLDIDLLYDARGSLRLYGSDMRETGLIGILKSVDESFMPTGVGSFRAVNDKGFMVDLITPSVRNPAGRRFKDRIGENLDDLVSAEIEGLTWLESSPQIEQIVIDERGYPLSMIVPDPRAFVLHKAWLSKREDRDPVKRRRDLAQAKIVIKMLISCLPHMRFDDPVLNALPVDVRIAGAVLIDEVRGSDVNVALAWDEE